MLDQSFSEENFKKILDLENRKGIYLEGNFFPDIVDISIKIKNLNNKLKVLKKKGLSEDEYKTEKEKLNKEKDKLKFAKEELFKAKLNKISSKVTSPSFKIEIEQDTSISSKPVYKTSYKLENILTLKQLQYNFRKLYKVKQANRYSILSQLKNILDDGFPKIILKTDIKEFYESIPQDRLLKKIADDNLLTHLSRKFIKQILIQYNKLSGSRKGVPRGIGISAYLVELYMREIDTRIQSLPHVIYYSRYVDDIVVILSPSINTKTIDYKSQIKTILENEELTMNEEIIKTKEIDLSNKSRTINYDFDYLGYRFISGYNSNKHIPLKVTISKKKKKRYAERLLNAFSLYLNNSSRNEKQARKLFVKRIRFLMNNTRLVNNKKNILTGIYYTNNLINTLDDFISLDRYFRYLVFKFQMPANLKNRITVDNSFVSGFDPSKIKKFNSEELKKMMDNWIS